jgi:hypothetical protein
LNSIRLDRHSGLCSTPYPVVPAATPNGRFLLVRREIEKSIMFGVIHTDGSGEDNPPLENLSDLYDELSTADREHGDVAVVHDGSGWCMSAHRDGRLVFEQLGTRGTTARHMIPVPEQRVLELWKRLIAGDINGLLKEQWKPGYGT